MENGYMIDNVIVQGYQKELMQELEQDRNTYEKMKKYGTSRVNRLAAEYKADVYAASNKLTSAIKGGNNG